jgi:hypothetical protein
LRPGDYLFGVIDGACVIPVDAATEAFKHALEQAPGEKLLGKAPELGSGAVDPFKKHGIM